MTTRGWYIMALINYNYFVILIGRITIRVPISLFSVVSVFPYEKVLPAKNTCYSG